MKRKTLEGIIGTIRHAVLKITPYLAAFTIYCGEGEDGLYGGEYGDPYRGNVPAEDSSNNSDNSSNSSDRNGDGLEGMIPASQCYVDGDSDFYGDQEQQILCAEPDGSPNPIPHAMRAGDCDDDNQYINPGVQERCDPVDWDCDGNNYNGFNVSSVCYTEGDSCRTPGEYICAPDGLSSLCSVTPRSPQEEECNGIDDDCDGIIDNNLTPSSRQCYAGAGECRSEGLEYRVCAGAKGWGSDYGGCDAVSGAPSAEIRDGLDNDCDGEVDEDTYGTRTGDACQGAADCNSWVCISPDYYPGGYCSQNPSCYSECISGTDFRRAVCVIYSQLGAWSDGDDRCVLTCNTDDECREFENYLCKEISGSSYRACLPENEEVAIVYSRSGEICPCAD